MFKNLKVFLFLCLILHAPWCKTMDQDQPPTPPARPCWLDNYENNRLFRQAWPHQTPEDIARTQQIVNAYYAEYLKYLENLEKWKQRHPVKRQNQEN